MGLWTSIKSLLGFGASAAGSAAGGAALGGIPGAVEAGATAVSEVSKGVREAGRNATERAIAKEQESNEAAIDAAIRKATQNSAALGLICLLGAFLLAGCSSVPSRAYGQPTGNVERLLARPDFDAAAKAAPEWTRDSLKTVNGLEAELQRERARANHVP